MFCSNSVIRAAVEELCHYHPMGVYYYVCKVLLVKEEDFENQIKSNQIKSNHLLLLQFIHEWINVENLILSKY